MPCLYQIRTIDGGREGRDLEKGSLRKQEESQEKREGRLEVMASSIGLWSYYYVGSQKQCVTRNLKSGPGSMGFLTEESLSYWMG